jgi:peptidyl-prolyl cis-trans isomerase SurA
LISEFDLGVRLSLVIASSNLDNTVEVRRRLAPQVLRNLVDDKLKLQEAKRLNIAVTRKDIDGALQRIERQNKLAKGGLDGFLRRNGIQKTALIEQVEARIAWTKTLVRSMRAQIQVGDQEVEARVAEIQANAGKPELRVAEIFIPVDAPEMEADAKLLTDRLVNQIREGADFSALARNFSRSATAALGGDLGWVHPDQLAAELVQVLAQMKQGNVSLPIRTLTGYHILSLGGRRTAPGLGTGDVTLGLTQLHLPLDAGATQAQVDQQMHRAQDLAAPAADCAGLDAIGRSSGSPLSGGLGQVRLDRLPPNLQAAVGGLAIGQLSPPIRVRDGVVVLMVCERRGQASLDQARQRVRDVMRNERMGEASRQRLRELHREAYVEVRL